MERAGSQKKKKKGGKRFAPDLSPSTDSEGSHLTPRTGTAISEVYLVTQPRPRVPEDEDDVRTVLLAAFSPAPPAVLGSEGDWGQGHTAGARIVKVPQCVCVSCSVVANSLQPHGL